MSSSVKPLDPLKHARYTLHPADGLISKPRSTGSYGTVRYNFKPKDLKSNNRRSIIGGGDNDRFNLTVMDKSGGNEEEYLYSGRRRNLKRSYALVFDQTNHTCTLEPLSSAFTFNVQSTPTESSPGKLIAKYPKLKPRDEAPLLDDNSAGDNSTEVDPNGPPESNNPFDYRHFMRSGRNGSRSPSPDTGRSTAGTPRTGASQGTNSQKAELTASNVKKEQKRLPTKARNPSPPAGTTLSKSRTSSGPSIRLDRRASSRNLDAQPIKKTKAQTNKPSIKSAYYVDSDLDDDSEDDPISTQGGLEIDFGDSKPIKSRSAQAKGKKGFGLPGTVAGGGPISLRSAANSANTSPAHQRNTPNRNDKTSQVIDFGDVSAKDDDDDDVGDGGYDEDDEGDDDVEPMTLGSPAHNGTTATQQDDEDDALADEFEKEMAAELDAEEDDSDADAMEQELIEGLTSQDDGAAVINAQGNESEESEEE